VTTPERLTTRIAELVAVEKNGTERALEIGRLLNDAKLQIAHGGWLPFVRQCGLGPRAAQLYMQAAWRWRDDDADAQRVAEMKLQDVWKLLKTPKRKVAPVPPAVFPSGNIANLPVGPCSECGRACGCAPAFASAFRDEEAAA
jgi:hypothetical protein